MNSVRVLNRSVFAAIFLVTICYGLQDLRPIYKIPRSSYTVLVDGRERVIMFPLGTSKRDDQSGNLVDLSRRDEIPRGYSNPSEPGSGHGKETSPPPYIEEMEVPRNQSREDKLLGQLLASFGRKINQSQLFNIDF